MRDYCMLCSCELSAPVESLYAFPSVTSDCRFWSSGRSVVFCNQCGLIKRRVLDSKKLIFGSVYDEYSMFSHSLVVSDQSVFDESGLAIGRTRIIADFARDIIDQMPRTILDIGSGNGAGLVALAEVFSESLVFGCEPNDVAERSSLYFPKNVMSVNREYPEKRPAYDLVTLFHVLEHVEDLLSLLKYISDVLLPGGKLLIQVPLADKSPFDFVIADHVWHFTESSMANLLRVAGYRVVYLGNDVLEKELTVIAVPCLIGQEMDITSNGVTNFVVNETSHFLQSYKSCLDAFLSLGGGGFVYGTGPSSAFVGAILGDLVEAYIDDDVLRIGGSFCSKKIVGVGNLGDGKPVFLPFPDYQIKAIMERNPELNVVDFRLAHF